jgi:hypothetical protein
VAAIAVPPFVNVPPPPQQDVLLISSDEEDNRPRANIPQHIADNIPECIVCFINAKDCIANPCGHGNTCHACHARLAAQAAPRKPRCPMCRRRINGVILFHGIFD